MPEKRKPDAAESNAGDDFHVLWALRKALNLLNFSTNGLKAIALEGLSTSDEKNMSGSADSLLGVDITEYFGGENFHSADKVTVSQLKYSTRHPDKAWSVSDICRGKKGDKKGSIVHRLAEFFSGFGKDHSRQKLSSKLTLKLVSNRPAAPNLLSALADAQTVIKKDDLLDFPSLLKQLKDASVDIIKKIYAASEIPGPQFQDFLGILDLSDCNADPRLFQEQQIMKFVSESGSIDTKKQFEALYGLVRRKMLPESRNTNTIIQLDVLYEFGLSDLRDLLPVPARFENYRDLVQREETAEIIAAITDPSNDIFVIHGSAGIGKSTIVNQLAQQLPPGSAALIYDSYGGGTYLDSDDKRHKPEKAFMQLSNELALHLGTPLVLAQNLPGEALLLHFKKRIELAANNLRKINPSALVVIFIDAADNSITAALQNKEESFVNQIINMSVPSGCKLIVTSRTGRLQTINFPEGVKAILLQPFKLPETKEFLRLKFAEVTDKEAEEFHQLTGAIPRVMSYSLSAKGPTLKEKLQPLKPDGKNLDEIFKDAIKEADKKSGKKGSVKDVLTLIIHLPRPVPLGYIQLLSGISEDAVRDIGTDLWRGLILHESGFGFRDEDFENFLRTNYQVNAAQLDRIADVFLAKAAAEDYASIHLGTALSNASRTDQLLQIVLEQQYLDYPRDPIRNKDVFLERTKLAMRLCSQDTSYLNLLKLQMVLAEVIKTNSALENILLNNPDLATAYGDFQMNQRLYLQSGNPGWFGSVHLRLAAIYAKDKSTGDLAAEHLEKAERWITYRNSLGKERRKEFELNARDIAHGAVSLVHLHGLKPALNWLLRWQPNEVVREAVELLLKDLFQTSSRQRLAKLFRSYRFPADLQLLIIKSSCSLGLKPPLKKLNLYPSMDKIKQSKSIGAKSEALVIYCEYALRIGTPYNQVKDFLELIEFKIPSRIPSFIDSYRSLDDNTQQFDLMLRKACLRELFEQVTYTAKDFYPQTLKVDLEQPDNNQEDRSRRRHLEEEKSNLDRSYKYYLKAYRIRASALVKKKSAKVISDEIKALTQEINYDYNFSHRSWEIKYVYKFLATKLLDICLFSSSIEVAKSIQEGFQVHFESNISFDLALAGKLSHLSHYHLYVLELLQRVDSSIKSGTLPASEQLDHYKEAAIIASRISQQAGKYYFDQMVLSSEEIDEEARNQIKAFSHLVRSETGWKDHELSYKFARYTEYCSERLEKRHFPWDECAKAIARLEPATAMATVCRWDHRRVLEFGDHFIAVLHEALYAGYIDHITAAALLPLNRYYWPGLLDTIQLILVGYDNNRDAEGKENFVRNFLHDFKLNFSSESDFHTLELLHELISNSRFLSNTLIRKFSDYFREVSELLQISSTSEKEKNISGKDDTQFHYEDRVKMIDPLNAEQILQTIDAIKAANETNYFHAEGFFTTLRKYTPANGFTIHLDILIDLDSDVMDFWSFKHSVVAALKQWSSHPGVRAWKKVGFARMLRHHFNMLVDYNYVNIRDLKELAAVFDVSANEFPNILFNILPEHLDELSTAGLYDLLEITGVKLNKNEKTQLLVWLIDRWSNKMKDNFSDGPWVPERKISGTWDEVTAKIIRYHLGHPDKRLRWRAAHSLRRFALLKQPQIFPLLLQEQNNWKLEHFSDAGYIFYWLSAKLYLWIAIERISKENLASLLPYKNYCIEELKNNNEPHALILHFVKSTCKALQQLPGTFSQQETVLIKQALHPKIKASKRKRTPGFSPKAQRAAMPIRFDFDSMDTIPYWFNPLAEVLGCNTNDLLLTADKYISQQWGFLNDEKIPDPGRWAQWEKTSHRHGSEPEVEVLDRYWEYHAMFCAAGEWVRNNEILQDPDHYETWDSWLLDWGLQWDDYWLADLRDIIPPIKKLWRRRENESDWEWSIRLEDFNNLLGLNDEPNSPYIPVKLGMQVNYGKDYETSTISSCLVDPRYATSLLATLQTDQELNNYIPYENDRNHGRFSEEETADDRFTLKGWLRQIKSERKGIDESDELFRDINRTKIIPGSAFEQWAGLQYSPDYRFSFAANNPDNHISILEVWSNAQKKWSYGDQFSNGIRLIIKKEVLLKFLRDSNHCLIMEMEIKRHVEHSQRVTYYPAYTYIYLIHPNGKIDTLSGRYQLR
jgi:hypothetical protein